MTEKKEFRQRPIAVLMMQSVALMAALFTLIISVLLIADHVRLVQMDPLNDPVLLQLRKELADSSGGNEQLVEQIRTYDLYARRAFFGNAEQRRTGGRLLLGGAVVCFLAFKLSRYWNPRLPDAGTPDKTDHAELNALFRQLMAGTGIFLVAIALFLVFAVKSDLTAVLQHADIPDAGGDPQSAPVAQPGLPETFAANWPSLRGSGNLGVAQVSSVPVDWDAAGGKGVLWKKPVPVPGFNSPLLWGDRLFMTGADDEGQEVFCFHADTGELLWTRTVDLSVELPEVSDDTGYAAPTMATDGVRVFAIFASGELAAFDMDGGTVWQKNIGLPDNPYGMGSSLISDGRYLFIQYDHLNDHKVMALDGTNGDVVWETAREHISWASPSLIDTGSQLLLILNDEAFVTAYDPATGSELWQVKCLGGEVAPSPAFNGTDILFVGNEYAQSTALRLTNAAPEMLWQYDDYLPEIASPLATPQRIYIPTTVGDMVCLDAETGEVRWEQEFDDGFNASPIFAAGRIYAADNAGIVHIFDDADEYHAVADIDMGEPVYATPAFAEGRIYIRGDENLYCIGEN